MTNQRSPSGRDKDIPKSALDFCDTFVHESGRDNITGHGAIERPIALTNGEHGKAEGSVDTALTPNSQSSASTSPNETQPQIPTPFPLFAKLPLELQTDIWKKALPEPDYVTLYPDLKEGSTIVFEEYGYPSDTDTWVTPVSDESDDEDEITYKDHLINSPQKYLPPQQREILTLLKTCQESRKVAMATYNAHLPMSLGRIWRMDGNRDTFVPISIKSEFRRPLHRTTYKDTWNTLMKNVKHIALFCDVFNRWSKDNQAWFVAQFPDLKTLSMMFTHEGDIAFVIQGEYEDRITTPENLWRNSESTNRIEVRDEMPLHQANLQRYKERVDPTFNPPTLIAVATRSGEEYGIELYGGDGEASDEAGSENEEGAEDEDSSNGEEVAIQAEN
ncbi:hypothetical protein DL98DRAFT_654932 [Cadophora sp. DSE1049]|nr:hypothetical protein DL98DRAFT_654932 [Cadophora sp. DSE1049]